MIVLHRSIDKESMHTTAVALPRRTEFLYRDVVAIGPADVEPLGFIGNRVRSVGGYRDGGRGIAMHIRRDQCIGSDGCSIAIE